VRAGAVDKHPVIAMDLFPTLLDAAGVPPPGPVDGESLLPLLLDTGGLDRSALFWHFPAYLERYGETAPFRARPYGAVRMGPWKLIEHFEDGRLELYHLRDDPGEEHDLAESQPEKRAELYELLVEWREQVGAPVPTELEPAYGKAPGESGR
jgi:arylsulfatase A-like enzyme